LKSNKEFLLERLDQLLTADKIDYATGRRQAKLWMLYTGGVKQAGAKIYGLEKDRTP